MLGVLLLGLSLGDIAPNSPPEVLQRARVHRLSGVAAALVVVLVNSISITYFIGTGRWCKEVVDTYSLDRQLIAQSNRLKRSTFPYALLSMLAVVGIVALGGAADPAAALRLAPIAGMDWDQLHLLGAMLGIAFIGYTYFVQWTNIVANRDVIESILAEVRRIRTEKGLEV
jgi:hypothetical protein